MKGLLKGLGKLAVILLILGVIGLVVLYFLQDLVVYPGRDMYRGDSQEWQSRVAAVVARGFHTFDLEGPGGRRLKGVRGTSAQGTAPAILWLHGFGENISEVNPQMSALMETGCHVFVLQYPGYGNSPGETTEASVLADAEALHDALEKLDDVANGRVLVGGEEMGATVALLLASRRPVDGVIAVAPSPDLATELGATPLGKPVAMMAKDRFDANAVLPRIAGTVLLVRGVEDEAVSQDRFEAMAAALSAAKVQTLVIPGAGHRNVFEVGGRSVVEGLKDFVAIASR
jgi:pimeloyl-ACP methyl ester carboxylesterase